MKRVVGQQTVLTKAAPNTESLRTTVPMHIVRQFGLQDGDRLSWRLESRDNQLFIVVTSVETKETKKG
jgi:bifunctional DNA-binding transcriptional regulator/antitoxin component of YhaV-PrlF toxin-antitoxin module